MNQAREILKGNTRAVGKRLYDLMMKNAELLKFEIADDLKKKLNLLNEFVAKSEVVSYTIDNVDVFTIVDNEDRKNAYINYIHVKNGTINQSFTYEYKRKLEETDEELLITAIPDIRERFKSKAKEIIVPFEMEWKIKDAEFFVPQRGDKKHLLELSEMNGKQYKFDRLKQAEKLNPEQKQTRLMKELQNKLKLEKLPYQIECFDNSNISGTDAVAGCIVYKGMKPSRKDYRKYNIKTVVGPDDYASMQEVVRRRYSRMIEEKMPLPDLIITDGGKGQMDVVREVVVEQLHINIPIAGLAKDDRHRTNELLFGYPPQTIGIDVKSELFKLLTQIQDEVHRYAISFHRDKRSKHALHSELDDIKGIGPKAKEALLKRFKTVKAIKESNAEALEEVLGKAKTKILQDHFNKQTQIDS
jgi:excinuclease ABC subunit C